MSLQVKILLIVLVVFSLYAVLDYTCQYFFVLPSFISLEHNDAQNTTRRCIGALKREISNLDKPVKDRAASDDTYQFVKVRKNNYISTNLSIDSFTNNNLNLIYICDITGKVVWGQIRDLETKQTMQLDEFPAGSWPTTHPLLGHKTMESSTAGVFTTQRGPMLVASRPIVTGKNNGPIRGTLIMGRFLNDSVLNAIAEQVPVNLKVWTIANGSIPAKEKDALNYIKAESQFHIRKPGDNFIHVYTLFPGIQKTPALLMRADIPRDVRARGIAGLIRSGLLSNLTAGLFVLLVLLVLLRVAVIDPIRKLTDHAIAIGNNDNISTRFTLPRTDEIGTLAREFDCMVEQLTESRRKLFEQSYYLGKAEVASGVLHNARNVLTPLVCHIDDLQKKLREVPIEKIETAQAELTNTSPSDPRREDLTGFINLSYNSLITLVRQAKEKLKNIAKLVTQIEKMLDEQGKFSHTELPTEETRLDSLVQDSIALLPNNLCDAISIQTDPSIEAIEPVMVHSISLLQVFNNVLINAAESIRRADPIRGKICIRAESDEVDGADMTHIQISDNGEGIEQCNLGRIFERGVSTKLNIPSGIGLHWCANTIAAMNGRIYAESKGKWHGACLHILLPASQKNTSVYDEKVEVKS